MIDILYSSLMNGDTTYNNKGEMVAHPPTAVQLRAARAIKQMAEELAANNNIVMQLQYRAELAEAAAIEFSNQLTNARKEIEQFKTEQKSLYSQLSEKHESLCKSKQEASDVGVGTNGGGPNGKHNGGDSTSEGGLQAEDSSPRTD